MSRIVYLCYRDSSWPVHMRGDIEKLSSRILPDNITPHPPGVIQDKGVLIGILNPVDVIPVKGNSVCMGNLINPREDWWRPGADIPDGTYALFRADNTLLELVTDIVGSRTIWYIKTDNLFIASTSQRAIVYFLGSFEPNHAVYPWMLSAGNLGPGLSWDKRIQCVPPNARLILNREAWVVNIHKEPVVFEPMDLPYEDQEARIHAALKETFANLELDADKWVLPLSGGTDSRAILLMLKDRQKYKAITWGLRSSLNDKHSDAYVAKHLADRYGLTHEYYDTDISSEPIGKILDRFIIAGEGRVDHIAGYMDGFALWKNLYEKNVQGVIRGDHGFGRESVYSTLGVRRIIGLLLLSDYQKNNMMNWEGLEKQVLPENLKQREGETLECYRDRLVYEYRMPYIMSALNDLKSGYTEIANPLLSRNIVHQVLYLPDKLRSDKSILKHIVEKLEPNIPFAENRAIATTREILMDDVIINYMAQEIGTENAGALMSNNFVNNLLRNIHLKEKESLKSDIRKSLKSLIKSSLPSVLKKKLKKKPLQPLLDHRVLALRGLIIIKMNRLLIEDSDSINRL